MQTSVIAVPNRVRARMLIAAAVSIATIAMATAATAATPPDAPTNTVATAGLAGTVTLAWTAPVNTGGEPILRYTVTASPGGATCRTVGTNCRVRGLTAGTSYSLSVVATNVAGSSVPSAPASATALALPGSPTNVKVSAGTVTPDGIRTVVTWTPPGDTGGSPLLKFTAIVSPGGRKCSVVTSLATPQSACTISRLLPNTAYTIAVTARTIAGSSDPAALSRPITFSVPPAPTGVSAALHVKGVRVTWSALSDTGNLPLRGYQVTSTPDALTCSVPRTELSCVVAGLRDSVSYQFSVTSTNALGVSPPSALSAPVKTGPPPPPAARNVTATTIFDATGAPIIKLSWLGPAGLVGTTSRANYWNSETAPPTAGKGSKISGRLAPVLPGDTGPRYVATIPAAAVRTPLAISVFIIGPTKRVSPPVSLVMTQPSVSRPVVRGASADRPVALRWQITGAQGLPVPGVSVVVGVRRSGTTRWLNYTIVSDAGGWVTLRRRFAGHTDVSFVDSGSNTRIGTALPVFQIRVASAVGAQLTASRVSRRTTVRLSGSVVPGKPAQPIYLQRLVGKVWRSVAVARTDARGRYSFALPTAAAGTQRYRSYVRSDSQNLSGASGQRILTVI